jgi:hypothetical protein
MEGLANFVGEICMKTLYQNTKISFIILLYGSSTSGKTTICASLKKLIHNLKIDGTDSAFKRLEADDSDRILNFLSVHQDQLSNLSQMQNIFTRAEICKGISNEAINIGNKEISLLFDLEDKAYEKVLEETFGEQHLIEKQAIITLRNIAKNYLDELFITVHKNMFDMAINTSTQGIPVILDIIPHPARSGQFMVDLFRSCLKSKNHTGKIHIALVYCSIPQLSERMLNRNQNSLLNDNSENIRDKSFPFRQYSQLFRSCNEKNEYIAVLKIEDAKKSIAPFCRDLAEMEKIIEKIGFNNLSNKINIRAKCEYDQIYNSDLQSSSEIAERIFKELL